MLFGTRLMEELSPGAANLQPLYLKVVGGCPPQQVVNKPKQAILFFQDSLAEARGRYRQQPRLDLRAGDTAQLDIAPQVLLVKQAAGSRYQPSARCVLGRRPHAEQQ